jgi:hypothetical protein
MEFLALYIIYKLYYSFYFAFLILTFYVLWFWCS